MGAQNSAVIDFGSTPTHEGSVVVTGQASIAAGSHVEAFVQSEASGYTEEYETAANLLKLVCGVIVAGTGFTIFATSIFPATGQITVRWVWN